MVGIFLIIICVYLDMRLGTSHASKRSYVRGLDTMAHIFPLIDLRQPETRSKILPIDRSVDCTVYVLVYWYRKAAIVG